MNCCLEDCIHEIWARKMCSLHYKKWYRDNHPKTRKAKDGEVRRTNRWREQNDRKIHDAKYRERHRQECNERIRKWAKENPEKLRARDAKRRAVELNALPKWADIKAIEAIYKEARRLTKETGIQHHVDHIVPLVSPFVCGLHVPENLQILIWTENLSKGNKF